MIQYLKPIACKEFRDKRKIATQIFGARPSDIHLRVLKLSWGGSCECTRYKFLAETFCSRNTFDNGSFPEGGEFLSRLVLCPALRSLPGILFWNSVLRNSNICFRHGSEILQLNLNYTISILSNSSICYLCPKKRKSGFFIYCRTAMFNNFWCVILDELPTIIDLPNLHSFELLIESFLVCA